MAAPLSKHTVLVALAVTAALTMAATATQSKFSDLFQPLWALDHFLYEGEVLQLKLDKNSGK